jgi:predicted 2-oxoglutarate/Fe(II)-dependent dioxygenase YbiX
MFDNLQLDLQAGDLLIFPSNFMYPHRVEPVTNGERYSFISWMW